MNCRAIEKVLMDEARRIGLENVEFKKLTRHSSMRFSCPDGRDRIITYSCSTSDHRAIKNIRGDLLRAARAGGYKF